MKHYNSLIITTNTNNNTINTNSNTTNSKQHFNTNIVFFARNAIPPMSPTQMYKCMMVVPKEEATIPAPTINPPVITTGLLPYRFTSMLLTGPAGRQVMDRFMTVKPLLA